MEPKETQVTDTPIPRHYTKYSESACRTFLEAFKEFGNVTATAKIMHLSRKTLYEWRKNHEEFRLAWEEADAEVTDSLLQEGIRRARDGFLKPVFQSGERVGEIREYSDSLLKYMLQVRMPELRPNRQSLEVSNKPGESLKIDTLSLDDLNYDELSALQKIKDDVRARLSGNPGQGNPEAQG